MAFRNSKRILTCMIRNRSFSTESKLVSVSVNDKNGIATVTLQRPPVNSLNLDLLEQISSTLTDLEKNRARGMILTSASSSVFSAGLDIFEMYKPDPDRVRKFWSTLQETWLKLYGSPFPTVAAINGHAPAGGCLLSVSCEYRVMVKNFVIGLNETQLGIVAPPWFMAAMRNTIGRRDGEKALTLGTLFKADEALKIGLIDEIVENKEEALAKSEAFLLQFSKISPVARALTKQMLRRTEIEDLKQNRQRDLDTFLAVITDEKVQKGLGMYLESLKKKKA